MKVSYKLKEFFKWEVINRLKGNNVPVVAVCLMHNGKVLAQTAQKNNTIGTNDTQYVVPGGKVEVEFGETLAQAVHREMKEETNLNVDILKRLGTVRNNKYELNCFMCVPMDISQMRIMEPGKQKELKFVDVDDKSINWTPSNKVIMERFGNILKHYKQYMRD